MGKKNLKKKNIIVKCASDMFLPLAGTFGCYVVLHGSSSPGGGFQGGVLIASAILLVFLGYGAKGVKKYFSDHKLHSTETVAELIYVVIAIIGVFTGLNFCVNFVFNGAFLNAAMQTSDSVAYQIMSRILLMLFGGEDLETSMLMNDAVGYHVMAGIMFLLILMLNAMNDDDEDKSGETGETDEKEALE